MANEWELARSAGRCAITGREFAQGETFYAAVFETPAGIERRDYAVDSWTGPPEGCFCHWRGKVPTRGKKPAGIEIDPQMLTQLFVGLEDEPSENKQQFRFVLALLLMRKRILRFEQAVKSQDQEQWQMRLMTDKSLHSVINPRLGDGEISRLSTQLTALLSGDIEALEVIDDGGTTAVQSGENHAAGESEDEGKQPQESISG